MTPTDPTHPPLDSLDRDALLDSFDEDDSWGPLQERFSAYIEGDLSPEERADFERDLAHDPSMQAAFDEFQDTINALSSLRSPDTVPTPPSLDLDPETFVRDVEGTIRKRSRGRFFHDDFFYRTRLPYELFAVVMLLIIAGLMYFGTPSKPAIQHNLNNAMGGPPETQDPSKTDKADTPNPTTPPSTSSPSSPPTADNTAPANPAPVQPIRSDRLIYTLTIQDPNPTQKLSSIQSSLTSISTSIKSSTHTTPQGHPKLVAHVPRSQVKDLLRSFGQNAKIRSSRVYVQGAPVSTSTLTFIITPPNTNTP